MNAYYTWFPKVFNMSVTAGIVILCVLVVRVLLKQMPKIFSYALWSVVLLRLLCPVSFDSDLSLFGLLEVDTSDRGVITYVPENIVHTEYPVVHFPIEVINVIINEQLPQGEEQLVCDPLEAPVAIATNLWLTGIVVMWLYAIWQLVRLMQKLTGAVKLKDNIYETDYIATPFVIGILRPRIYLPTGLQVEEREYIICHEQIHIGRRDPMFRILAFAALSVHWFNPLVWVAFYLSGVDMEMSCDEAVMRRMGMKFRADYSASLLRLATGKRTVQAMPLAFGEGNVKERIKNIVGYKKPAVVVTVCVSIVLIGLVYVLAGNPEESVGQNNVNTQENVVDGTDIAEGTAFIELNDANAIGGNNEEHVIAHEYEIVEITPPSINENMPVGVDGTILDYAAEDRIIFHDYYGLFVFDLQSQRFLGAVDLNAIGCHYTQGDNYCEVSVDEFGTKVYLHPLSEQEMYVYNVTDNTLTKQVFDMEGIETYNRLIKTSDLVFRDTAGDVLTVAGDAVANNWYLESESGMVTDLCYVQVPHGEVTQTQETVKISLFQEFE